jgi:hypothetical protein
MLTGLQRMQPGSTTITGNQSVREEVSQALRLCKLFSDKSQWLSCGGAAPARRVVDSAARRSSLVRQQTTQRSAKRSGPL